MGREHGSSAFETFPDIFPRVSLHLAVPDFILYKKKIVSIALLSLVSHSSELLHLRGLWEPPGFVASWSEIQVAWGPHLCLASQGRQVCCRLKEV